MGMVKTVRTFLVATLVIVVAVSIYSLSTKGGGDPRNTVRFQVFWLDQPPAQCFYSIGHAQTSCDLSLGDHNPDGSGTWLSAPQPRIPGTTYALFIRMNEPVQRVSGSIMLNSSTVKSGANYHTTPTSIVTITWKG